MKRAAVLLCLAASAASAATPAEMQRNHLIKEYRSCVMGAAIDQTGRNLRLVAEQAFFACSTEEQSIRALLNFVGVPPATTQELILRIKIDLKKIITLQP